MTDVNPQLLASTANIVAAYVRNNQVPASQMAEIIQTVHAALGGLDTPATIAGPAADLKPAVPVKKSITPDYLISLESGKKFKTLKRYLATSYGMTPDDYRTKWALPPDYPMTAPNYAAYRSQSAKDRGLGRKPAATETALAPAPKRGRKKAA